MFRKRKKKRQRRRERVMITSCISPLPVVLIKHARWGSKSLAVDSVGSIYFQSLALSEALYSPPLQVCAGLGQGGVLGTGDIDFRSSRGFQWRT